MKETKYGIANIDQFSKHCFFVCLVIGFFILIAIVGINLTDVDLMNGFSECTLHKFTGIYCFGCGGTRACICLAKGEILASIFYHPFVPYMAAGYLAFVASHCIHYLSGRKVHAMRFCPVFFYIGIVILFIQCIAKNVLLFRGFDYLKWLDGLII